MFSCWCSKSGTWDVPHVPESSSKKTALPVNSDSERARQPTPPQISSNHSEIVENETQQSNHVASNNIEDQIEDEPMEVTEEINVKRRSGLAGHAANIEKQDLAAIEVRKHSKEKSDEILIKEAISKNDFLRNLLEGQRLQGVIDAMYSRDVDAKEIVIQEGSVGTQLYISAAGTYEITIDGKLIANFQDNRVFGELAILYNAKRQATIKALQHGKLWVLDQNVYQRIMLRSEIEHHDQLLNFLRNVPKLNTVSSQVLSRVADLLKREFFNTDTVIVRQGDRGDKFYIISAGNVTITKDDEEVAKMHRGEFFGQLALLNEENLRQATVTADAPGVECFSLSRSEFIEHFGDVEDMQHIPDIKRKVTEPVINPYHDVELSNLKRIETLGVGGFGRVELVQHKDKKDLTFALKYLKKTDMVQQDQKAHVFNEKNIQMKCNTLFIVRMYKTFHDKKYLYFLMEPCLGGDLWSLLQRQKNRRFEEEAARFFAASVLEAFAYLHERGIVYRDLKPENLILDTRGYLKLTDFGFAKELGPRGKTFTFAGTPEYVAPEIVLNRGHDKAVDYWALGIFIYELLAGRTPFKSNDSSYMDTYNMILRGIENVQFIESITKKAEHLIKRLCRGMATERLGCQKEGVQSVRDHRWFTGLDWEQIRAGTYRVPFKRSLTSNTDTRFFDKYPKDSDIPADEESGWDDDF